MQVIHGNRWCRRFSDNDTAVVPDVVTQKGIEYVRAALMPPTAIAAAVVWFATTGLLRAAVRPPLESRFLPNFEGELLGLADVHTDPAAARAASPRWRVHPDAPPFLVMHGDRDRLVPDSQSTALQDALVDAGADSTLVLLGGAA